MRLAGQRHQGFLLLVEPDAADRDQLGGWLERAGFCVINCPGPDRVDFTCLGVRGQRCALVEVADLAILDLRVLQDAFNEEAPSRRLLRYYLSSGKPVIVIRQEDGQKRAFHQGGVTVLKRRPSRRTLMRAVQRLLDEAN